jgi:hypothetical protein
MAVRSVRAFGRGRSVPAVALVSAWILAVLGVSGCGYTVVGAAPEAGDGSSGSLRVAVHTFVNSTTEPGAELVVTDALRRELFDRPRVAVVRGPEGADWTVEGRVNDLRIRTETFSSVVLALEQSLTLRVSVDIRDAEGKPLELSDSALSGTEVYLASADIEVTRKNRTEALRRVAGVIARRVGDALEMEATP